MWLAIWIAVAFFWVRELLKDPATFLSIWAIGWTLGGGFVLYVWLWMIAGREIISLDSGRLVIRRCLLGHVRVRQYDLEHVSNLRVDPEPYDSEGPSGAQLYGFGAGPIAFDYGEKTVRFASGIREAEAHQVFAELSHRLDADHGSHRLDAD